MKKMKFWQTLLLTIIFAGCSNPSPTMISKYTILDKSPCTLPCWNNVISGKTSKADFLNTLSNLEGVDKNSISEIESGSKIYDKIIRFNIIFDQGKNDTIHVDTYIQKDTVLGLFFLGNVGLNLGKVIKDTGEPENIISMAFPGNYTLAIMLNKTSGIAAEYGTYDSKVILNEGTPLTALIIFASEYYEPLMEEGLFSSGMYNQEETMNVMYKWVGYGNINEKYPHRNP